MSARERGKAWLEYSAEDLGQEIARIVTDMAAGRDATIEELRKQLETADAAIEEGERHIDLLVAELESHRRQESHR